MSGRWVEVAGFGDAASALGLGAVGEGDAEPVAGSAAGGETARVADHVLLVPSDVTARIQEMHITLGQMLCAALEIELGLVTR